MTFRGGRRGLAVLAAVLVAVAGIIWIAWPSDGLPQGQDVVIPVVDGPADDQKVLIDAAYFPPEGGGRAPAVLLGHGFGGSKNSVRDQAGQLAEQGYAVLTWSARGFGRSTGEIALNSPDYEVKDVRQLIDWLAKRPEVLLDAAGDPRVGMAGGSYGGAIALMTAAHDPRVDAIVPSITWYDLADALFPEASGAGPAAGVFKKMWAGIFFSAGGSGLNPASQADGLARLLTGSAGQPAPAAVTPDQAQCGRFLPAICAVYQEIAATGKATPEAVDLLRKSSPISVQGKIKVPSLIIQGQRDSLFPLGHADLNAKAIAATGAPVEVAWIAGGHDGGDAETDFVFAQTLNWFDAYLKKDGAATGQGFTVSRDGGRDPGTRQNVLLHAEGPAYAGLGGTVTTALDLLGPDQEVATPPGGSPAAISSVPGLSGLLGGGAGGGGSAGASLDLPGQVAVFQTRPLDTALTVTGSPTAEIRVYGEGEVTLFAKLYDAASGQLAVLPGGLAAPLRVTATPAGTPVKVALPAIDRRVEAGHVLRLAITTTDMAYALPAQPSVHKIGLGSTTLTMPVDAGLAAPAQGPAWWTWAFPLVSVLAAAVLLLTGRPRRASVAPDPALAEVPLQITGLAKRYKNGHKAVDDLSFRVEKGQVLGLLGPNGAGKTTTMRMMMGLIHPDGGEIRIFGEKVVPGSPVLARLGSFVEGAGFLPHLSGRDNLTLYWQATGRPAADAHFEEALEIAGLGAAVERAVRTYSQGMRQRLAIAQAMLGLPDLLVLDEPTNGLDPPQIAEMRRVLKAYATEGRTVIVSSHLLGEVEQTCSHAVVMHRGRLVSAGPVAELLRRGELNGSTRLEDVFLDLIGEKA
ncbi:alpha/beta fold hydrolase [Herbidospora daliensis]|uniref:alpha/beta fold hydrolase n=1 Tax=Herbidospora daliensis TaxID=295585 RepID=UPI0007852F26|nr:alpha/beta fold hydrolase [Herbidospora daliensis]